MTMHVAVSGWLCGTPSGANRRLLALLAHAGERLRPGERITLLHRPDFVPPPLRGVQCVAIDIPAAPTWRRAFAEHRRLPALLQRLGATVLDHGFLPLPRVQVPVCLTVHDLRGVDGLTHRPRWLEARTLRRACERAAAVITPSRWSAERLHQLAPAAPAPVVIGNGVEVNTPPPTHGPAPFPLPSNGFLLHIGHLEARKNLSVVVRALARLPQATRPELWLVGRDAGARAALARCARRGDVTLRCLGVLPDAEVAVLYQHARAVVVPSRYEGFGLCALEALAAGRPLLAARATALPEVVGDDGLLLPVDDDAAWAVAIDSLPGQAAYDAAVAARARSRYAWADAAVRLLQTWRGQEN
ncbi:MAG: glycosyltransferase family 4 protein [Planctomycetes bacterium]|nr:glycosyltransferase family 4 protein [Planctomycetota bacterium]